MLVLLPPNPQSILYLPHIRLTSTAPITYNCTAPISNSLHHLQQYYSHLTQLYTSHNTQPHNFHLRQPYNVERSGSGVELRTHDYENPGSNPGCSVKTLGKFFHSTLLQFTQLNKNEYLAIDSGGYVYEQPSRIN